MRHDEHQHQVAVARHIDSTYHDLCWSASCGGMRTNLGTAVKMKAAGYKKGCPDIMIFEPRGTFHGLFIELKVPAVQGIQKAGKLETHQVDFLNSLQSKGYQAVVAFGAREAIEVIDRYLA
jgi:hypothetical protein